MPEPAPPPVKPTSVISASPGPLTTQPMIESDIGVLMCSRRFSSTSTVLITSKPCRAQDGQEMMLTPRWRRPSALRISKPTLDLLDRVGGEADAQGVADAHPEQAAEADRRLDRAGGHAAGLGDPEVDRGVGRLGEALVGGGGEEDVGGLHADLERVEVVVLEDADVVEAALDHRLRAGLAVLLEQVLLEAAGVDADAHRAAVVAGGARSPRARAPSSRCCRG